MAQDSKSWRKIVCFVCSGKNERIFKRLYEEISEENDRFYFYESALDLIKDVTLKNIAADLILLEYKIFKGFSEMLYMILKGQSIKLPVILLDFRRAIQNSVVKWVSENEFVLEMQVSDKIIEILKKIEAFILAENIFDDFPDNEQKNPPKEKQIPLKTFDLPPATNNLLSYFYQNRSREISLEEIENFLNIKTKSKLMRRNVAYSYISRLRKNCDSGCQKMKIIRPRKGFYQLLILKNPERKEGDDQ